MVLKNRQSEPGKPEAFAASVFEGRLMKPNPRKCKAKGCGIAFTPSRSFQCWCSPDCAVSIAAAKKEKVEQRKRSDERKADRAKREQMKTKPQLEAEVEQEMNRYVRLRDYSKGCISCGRAFNPTSIGGSCDAGHYRSKGSAKHLRFDERNVHGQCKYCNDHLASNPIGYRRGLIERIGINAVEALESDQDLRKYTKDELREMKATYRRKARELEKETAS